MFGRVRKQLRNWSSRRGSIPTTEHASGGWIYACAPGTPADELVKRVGFTDPHVVEIAAEGWEDEGKAIRDLAEAVGGENVYDYNWNALNDGMRDLPEQTIVVLRGKSVSGLRPRGEQALAKFVGCLDPENDRPKNVALVIDGWQHAEVEHITARAWQADVWRVTPASDWAPTEPPPDEYRRLGEDAGRDG